ncbi:MAG: hypothetical protein V5A27_01535 [Halapricum sp.]
MDEQPLVAVRMDVVGSASRPAGVESHLGGLGSVSRLDDFEESTKIEVVASHIWRVVSRAQALFAGSRFLKEPFEVSIDLLVIPY